MLGEYLRAASARPWEWGAHDCCCFPADWVLGQTGVDPLAQWRGYSTAREAYQLIKDAGGLSELWAIGLEKVGILTATPAIGDVGVIKAQSESGMDEIGGIFTGDRWAFVGSNGLSCVPSDERAIVAVWTI